MKISYNWLRQYLNISLPAAEVSAILTAIGLEVEDVIAYESLKGGLKGVVVGQVLTCDRHPNADKLSLTTVNIGAENLLKIVCGAPNVAAGQKVLVATIGTTIYPTSGEALTMKKAKIRGEESEGMICAEDELGLGTSHAGILILPETTAIGSSAADVLGIYNDTIFEIGLTPNRSDAFSHLGVAREVMAYLAVHQPNDLPKDGLQNPLLKPVSSDSKNNSDFKIEILDKEKCPRYCGVVLENITVKPSPEWLQNSLKAIGVRPINNVVDITNYVLHESSQPLHAFDAAKISGNKIVVKTENAGTAFICLDEKERKLQADDLMICDAEKPMCIAGVFGGLHSGVSDSTTKIFLESAWFNAKAIRKTSFHHQLRTDAALHFEKGIDAANVLNVLKRAAQLMMELCDAKIASPFFDESFEKIEQKQIQLSHQNVNDKLGIELSAETIETILKNLGFGMTQAGQGIWTVTVPTHKTDISIEADLVEEILRLYGLDKLPIPNTLQAAIPIRSGVQAHILRNKAAEFLAANGFSEMMNNTLTQSKYYAEKENLVTLLNSINTELDVLRNDLLFGGLEAIAHNQNRQNADLKLFEFGKIYSKKSAEKYSEQQQLCMWMTGKFTEKSWNQSAVENDIYALKAASQKLLSNLGIAIDKVEEISNEGRFDFGLQYFLQKNLIAEIGNINQKILKQFDIRNAVAYAKINWNKVENAVQQSKVQYKELSKFPAVKRDLAMLINEQIEYAQIENIAKQQMGDLLKGISLFDIYRDKKIGEDKKSYAISLTLQDEGKTLTDDKLEKMMSKLIAQLEMQLGAEIRKS